MARAANPSQSTSTRLIEMATDRDVSVARDIGSLQADVRTLKHDVGNVSGKLDAISMQISSITNQQSRGLGFFAGAAAVVTVFGGILIALLKLAFGGAISGGGHS